ncbi:MAG: hypothetical protein EPO68_09700 [Planctomycetota bacterium]|nr:MAG: hypothetical protein EPO68_09700 [Planctomycetota bacterium]
MRSAVVLIALTVTLSCGSPPGKSAASTGGAREILPTLEGKPAPVLCMMHHAPRPGLLYVGPDLDRANENLHPVDFAAFDDGTLVWREGGVGRRSYVRSRIPREALERALDALESLMARVPHSERSSYGPDAGYDAITLRGRSGVIRFESWHEEDPNSIAVGTHYGLEPRNGRSDEQLEREWPDDYRAFRTAWRAAIAEFESFRPAHGEPLEHSALEFRRVELAAR